MDPTHRSDRILDEWDAVAARARPATRAPRRHGIRSRVSATVLAGTGVAVLAIVLAVGWLGRPASDGVGRTPVPLGTTGTPTTAPGSASAAATPGSSQAAACDVVALTARILGWDGAAGQRTATVELTNGSTTACTVPRLARPQLVDGSGAVLIDGTPPSRPRSLVVEPGGVLSTLVQAGNYCGPAPTAPVSVAFAFDTFRLEADPVSPSDLTLPPCLGAPGSAGGIGMQPWRARP